MIKLLLADLIPVRSKLQTILAKRIRSKCSFTGSRTRCNSNGPRGRCCAIVQFGNVFSSETHYRSIPSQSDCIIRVTSCISVFKIVRLGGCASVCCVSIGIVTRTLITNNRPSSNSYSLRNISLLQLYVGCVRKMAKITLRESFHRTSLKQHHLDSLRFE
ncbi:hypothetical protein B0H50_12537 [Hallerella porci]|uniref:Uncharacterized protein n=1 Tax=Hallerella porci TaxID=1945871 RepID=A0ABX5LJB3_9BACT|nr:hypothetical protein B0H50_12537 [Hallerella porci]